VFKEELLHREVFRESRRFANEKLDEGCYYIFIILTFTFVKKNMKL